MIPTVTTLTGNTPQTGDSFARIGATGSGLTSLATQASVNTIDDFLDTEIAAIKAKTDNLPAAPAAVGDIPTAAAIADQVWDEVLAGHLTAGTTGNALNAAGAAGDPWTTALPGAYGAGTAGNIVGNRIDAAITSRLAPTVAARTLDVSATGEAGIDWANVGSPTTAVNLSATNISTSQDVANVVNGVDVVSMQNNVMTASVPSAAFYTAVTAALWDAATISYAADGSFGELVSLIYSQELLIKAKTDNLPVAPAAVGDIPTALQNADAVWDEAISGHLGVGSTGLALNAASSGGDPWGTALPGAYGSGTAGNIIGNRLDVATSTLATAANLATVAGYLDTEVAAIKAKTDNLPADPADASDIAASFTTVNTKLDTIDDFLDTEVAAVKAKTDLIPAAPAAVGDIPTVASILTTAITEAYRANGAAPTLAQFMSETLAHLGEASISGTVKTIKKLDHSTTAETFTLNDSVSPTAITRST